MLFVKDNFAERITDSVDECNNNNIFTFHNQNRFFPLCLKTWEKKNNKQTADLVTFFRCEFIQINVYNCKGDRPHWPNFLRIKSIFWFWICLNNDKSCFSFKYSTLTKYFLKNNFFPNVCWSSTWNIEFMQIMKYLLKLCINSMPTYVQLLFIVWKSPLIVCLKLFYCPLSFGEVFKFKFEIL